MKLPIRINFANPILYAIGFIFLFFVPYLYPSFHFPYQKVFSPILHLVISIFLLILVITSYKLSKIRLTRKRSLKEIEVPEQLYSICKAGILIALIMNTLIVLNALDAYNGDIAIAKKSIEEFGGINIISQTYMFFLPPFVYHAYKKGRKYKLVLISLGFILLIRSILMAERVAFLEFLIPVFITYFLATERKLLVTKILKYFSMLLLFFMILELSRQFYSQYLAGGGTVDTWFAFSWTLERFFAYYADTTNKFYYSLVHDLAFTTQNYLYPVERILSRISSFQVESFEVNYGKFKWKDFTNPGGLTQLYTDFGYLSIIAFLCLFAFFFKSFRSIQKGSIFALAIYPNLVTVILELPRFVGVYNTRFFVPFVLFTGTYILYRILLLYFPKEQISLNTTQIE